MTERRPTLALARSPHVFKEESSPTWEERLYDAGFNVLGIAYAAFSREKSSLVEASIGVVLVNRSAQDPDPQRDLSADGLGLTARTAHQLEIPVYLSGEPSEAQQQLAPFIVLSDDLSVISRQWPPELRRPTTGEVAAINVSAEAPK